MRWLDDVTGSMDMNLSKLWETGKDREAWRAAVHGSGEVYRLDSNSSEDTTALVNQTCTSVLCITTYIHGQTSAIKEHAAKSIRLALPT